MRSIHTIKSGDQGKKDYYTKDESLKQSKDQGKDSSESKGQKHYYSDGEAKSESEEMTQAVWFGKDAERLNLRGHGLQSDFEQIFDGYIPGTTDRIRGEKPREDHQENCIYDVVLSCKKSVSMQIHLGKDERLYKAYQETVLEIAELIERDYAQARIQVNGDRRIVQTEGIIALMIPHHTSRELDMNVHTHLAIANGTYCEDGKWRSLLDRGFSHAYYMGDYFSVRMAARVQALGYEIRETVTEEGHPSWELAGYTDEQIKVFSKRSENAKVKELVAAGVSRDEALLRTRKAKNAEETLEEAQGRWQVEADAFEIEAITPLDRPAKPKLRATAEQILESAIRHYGNRSNHFTRDQIREYAFKLNRTFTVTDLDRAIASHPELIDYGKLRGVDELIGHFTTAQAVEREIRTIKAWMQGQGQATPILDRLTASLALENIQLKTGQRSAIIGVLASDNQHQIIHGLSGVGKTTALRQLKMLTDRQQVEVMGFAPSIDAAKKLSKQLGIETHTVQSLVKSKRFELKPNQLLIIDEAGMVSAEMLDVVMQKANAAGARVLLVGDTGQNQAIEAGSPMRSLMKHGAEVHHIAEIIRQQNSIQRQAVELIAKGRGLDALSLLNEHDYINPVEDRGQRVSALAQEFLALSPEEQLNTLIVAGTNAEKDAITAEIRAGLKAEGRLGESRTVTQLRDRALTPEEARQIAYYRVGDYIKFSRNYKRISARDYDRNWLQKNVPYQVVGKEENELIVATAGGRRFRVNPSLMKDKQVFEGHEFDIAVGDSLRWTSSNQEKGQINGKTFKIAALDGNVATILTDDGLRQLDLSEALAVDYTLTSTSYRAQGSDRYRVFVCATNDPTSNREPFYVSISRQIKFLKIWTDDYDGLKRRVAESSVQLNPLELLGDDYGKRSDISAFATNVDVESKHGGIERTEQGAESPVQQHHEHNPDRCPGRDGGLSDRVRRTTGEPEALRDGGRDSGIERNPEGFQGQTDELGTDEWRDDLSSELRSRGDQNLRSEAAQQRLDESAADLRSRIERVVSSLTAIDDVELVRDSGIVESTREVIAALEPIVSGLEAPSVPASPKRDLSAVMARVINGLTAVDSEKVFSENGIVEEIKSLVSRVEAHTLAQEQFTNLGEHHVNHNNSSSESSRTAGRRDSGVGYDERESGIEPDRRDSAIERLTANIDIHSGQSSFIGRGDGNEADDRELARGVREAHQGTTETKRNQERDFPDYKAEPGNRPGTTRDRQVEYRDVGSEPANATSKQRNCSAADAITGTEQTRTIASGLFSRATDGLPALADAIVRIRLQRELAEPLAQLRSTLAELREVNHLNERLKAELDAQRSATIAHQVELASERQSLAANKAALLDRLEAHLAQAKIEVLDTTLTEWRSLREKPELELPEAIAPSEVAQLTSLLENYPAQKAIEYAMVEFNQAREQALETDTSSLDSAPKPRKNPPPKTKPKQSTALPGQTASLPKPKTRTQRSPVPKPVKPVEIAQFWQLDYATAQRPEQIEPRHWEEFKKSAIHPDLIALNAESVSGQEVYERLLSERLAQLGTGQYVTQPMARLMAQYEQVAQGGWWGKAGIDARSLINLQPGQQPQLSTWGGLKADNPRLDQGKTERKGENEYIKYENPLGVSRSLYLPIVPDNLANRIYKKHGIQPTAAEKQSGFWYIVRQYNLPITITEGAKKTWASLSQGEITIGLSGVNGIYQARDIEGKLLSERLLNEQMAVFATPGREFRFAFDQDTKAATIRTVRRDRVRGIELLEAQGCTCKVVNWKPEDGKGLDDLIANRGPLAYTQAIATAQTSDQDKRTHYRTEYNAIARQVRVNYPQATAEFLDAEVYLRTVAKAETKDGDRFISQSDRARSLQTPEQVQAYVDHIKTHAPQIRQQYRQALAAQAATEAQRVADRAEYMAIAQQVKTELGDIPAQQLDMEVCLRSGDTGNVDRVLAQSDQAIALDNPAQVQTYIERVKTDAPQYQQQKEELAEVNAQLVRDRTEYLSTVKFARRTMGDFREDQVDLYVCLSVGIYGKEADRVLAQSDTALALNDPTLVKAYIDGVKAQIPVYHQQKQVAQTKADRDEYEAIAGQLRPGLGRIHEIRLDAHVYRAAVESGKYTPERIDAILAQSKSALALSNPDEVSDHIKLVKEMASRPKFGNHRSSERAIAMSQQNKLNERAVEPCKWLAKNAGELNLKDGSYTWQMQGFCIHLNGDRLKVTSKGDEVVLESNQSVVSGNVSAKQIEVLQKIINLEKEQQAKQRVQQQHKSLNKKGRSR
jgi:conjugative relaxase-like TrwC/TraI family protein